MRRLTFLCACLFLVGIGMVSAQSKAVTGKVVSAEDESPIIGASVVVKGTTFGTITDVDGKFTISVPGSNATLVVSFIGMATQEVVAKDGMEILLESDSKELDEVMVVAYGSAKKSSFTGSAAAVDGKKLQNRPVSNITKALDSQVAGVQTSSGGGQPGNGANIVIRGFGSINASNNPLYVVDGIPYDGSINAINPNDIESVTVLKDASAGALYGARGANGVVLIITKKGSEDLNVNVKASWGTASRAIKRYNTVNQSDFVQLTYEALRNGYVFDNNYSWDAAGAQARTDMSSALGGEVYNPFKNYTWATIINENTGKVQEDAVSAYNENWMDALENPAALRQEYQLSVSGGNDKTKTLLSLGYLNEDGVLQYTNFERISGRLNVDNQAKIWFKTGLNASFSHTVQNYSDYDESSMANVWYTAQFIAPIYPVYTKDAAGNDVLDVDGKKQLDYGVTRPQLSNFNSIATLEDDKFDRKSDNFSGRAYITLGTDDASAKWARGIKFSVNAGVDYLNRNNMFYYNMYHGNFASYNGILSKENQRVFSLTFNQLLSYNRNFEGHDIDVMVGHEYYAYKYNYLYGSKSGLVDGIYELAPATTVQGTSSYEDNYRIESLLSRLNYNYDERYYLSASYRRDASSRFHKDNRWGNFWSVGGNWRISHESFMSGVDWINNLALKASYGVQGNDDLLTDGLPLLYAWQSFYDLTWPNASNAGAVVSSLENKDITWEKNANFNVGLDIKVLEAIDLSIEYYNKQTSDLLLNYPMALSTGFRGYSANVGQISNQGLEITLGARIINKRFFKWRTTIMASTLNNKVKKLTAESPEIINGIRVYKEGYEVNTFYMSRSAGVDPATGSQLYWVYEDGAEFLNAKDNTPYVVTRDADGNITDQRAANVFVTDDYAAASSHKWYLGSRIPDVYGAVNMEFEIWKGFDLSINTAYSIGGKIYESLYTGLMNVQYTGNTWSTDVLRRWQKPGDVTDVPRMEINGSYATNDRFLIDASYFSIKNITLGYTLPGKALKKMHMDSFRIFATVDNLWLFSHLDGMDPQYNFAGGTDYVYSPNRTVAFGLDINF